MLGRGLNKRAVRERGDADGDREKGLRGVSGGCMQGAASLAGAILFDTALWGN